MFQKAWDTRALNYEIHSYVKYYSLNNHYYALYYSFLPALYFQSSIGRIIAVLLHDFNLLTICCLYYPKLMEQNKTPHDMILEQVHLLILLYSEKVYLSYENYPKS
ncbi:hypothetical protein BN997_02579 [Oceanobacillus oncorhynchi]|uniref:Uncharacterized protein n=1 Tax=Oceanobacillus oncorhynchi TaxID=545501 RepID=A0A0A1MSP5_9BACI|nr:hypothetical protein BN997_02579 [Oceanobacillus oncorhynchi]